LLRTAPHLVTPLEFCIPIYARGSRGRWQIRAGLFLYDLLSLGKSLPRHTMLSRAEIVDRFPGLERAGLVGGASYFDAQVTYPERLVLELALDAIDHGADLKTYARVDRILVDNGRVRGVQWLDREGTGRAFANKVVNATGPWVDRVLGGLAKKRLIGGTRGSHLIVEPFAGAPDVAIYTEAVSDGRPYFVVPWNGLFLIGTTDDRFSGDPATVVPSPEECEYLVNETLRVFPKAHDIEDKVLYTLAGVRPLPHRPKGAEGAITRRHLIRHNARARGLYSIVGGKLTTHRALAADVMRRMRRRFRDVPRGSRTVDRALPGALARQERMELEREITAIFGVAQAQRWWRIYGAAAAKLLTGTRAARELEEGLAGAPATRVVELVHALENEHAKSLVDILQRRCMVGLERGLGLDVAPAAAEWLRRLGYWDAARAEHEVRAYSEFVDARRVRPRFPLRGSGLRGGSSDQAASPLARRP
jgi:glycerol-3-phosphate dehydrogenase